jgi:hypothetical protein
MAGAVKCKLNMKWGFPEPTKCFEENSLNGKVLNGLKCKINHTTGCILQERSQFTLFSLVQSKACQKILGSTNKLKLRAWGIANLRELCINWDQMMGIIGFKDFHVSTSKFPLLRTMACDQWNIGTEIILYSKNYLTTEPVINQQFFSSTVSASLFQVGGILSVQIISIGNRTTPTFEQLHRIHFGKA